MRTLLQQIRVPNGQVPLQRMLLHSLGIAAAGLVTGAAIKLLDIYTTNLGNIFSRLSVWILICSAIAGHSATPKRAAVNVFLFCAGMLATYYLTAEWTRSPYSFSFIYGWAAFSLCSPVFAFFTWYARGTGIPAKLLTAGIIVALLIAAAVLFDGIKASDWIIAILTVAVLRA